MKVLTLFLFVGFCLNAVGQNKPLLYNIDDLPQTLMSNPGAEIDFRAHVGIPLLSQFHFTAGTTGVNLHDIFNDANPDVNSRVREVVNRLTFKDHFMVNEQLEVFSLGFKINRRNYLSLGMYQELDAFAYFPKDVAVLAIEGNNNYIGEPFDFSQFSVTGEVLTVYHIGLNKIMNRRLTVGGRIKMYSGVFNAESTGNTGTFTTVETPEGPNRFRHFADDVDIRINTSGFSSLNEQEDMTVKQATNELLKRSFFGGNIGAGVDLGFSYKIHEQFAVTGSVLDLGLMYQRHDVENYLYFGEYQTDGIEPLFPDLDSRGRAIPYWDIFEDEVEENLQDETLEESYFTWRPFKINTSFELGFGRSYKPCNYLLPNNKVRFVNLMGMQIAAVKRPKGLVYSLSTYYDRKLSEKYRVKVAYTLDDYSYTNFGVMFSSTFNAFNVYIAAENIFDFTNLAKANHAAVQFGMQFILDEL